MASVLIVSKIMKNNQNQTSQSLYRCLTMTFWTKRHCQTCQQPFTKTDYHHNNYYLTFWELTIRPTQGFTRSRGVECLDGVIIYLFHHHCPLFVKFPLQGCSTETISETTNNHE
ncbi:MAG: hypothetical protein mread185_000581 [Mycoplasmataceae bacterium]|nr:MAG: hypothetical protein mread185_000581 [Mycoplasmataceae bacterium]